MIKSMTAFARQEIAISGKTYTWELRSLNHRYLDIHCKLPESFRSLEMGMRDKIRQHLARGKVECSLKEQGSSQDVSALDINPEGLNTLLSCLNTIHQSASQHQALNGALSTSALQVLQWPGVLQGTTQTAGEIEKQLLDTFEQALTQLNTVRAQEGDNLKQFILSRLQQAQAHADSLQRDLPALLAQQKQQLQERLASLQVDFDPQRLEQEIALLVQKSDIAEELDRLGAHINEVESLVTKKPNVVGRRLDFLMQELNREANTLASKSHSLETTQVAVELKVLIEQMREQIQNIE